MKKAILCAASFLRKLEEGANLLLSLFTKTMHKHFAEHGKFICVLGDFCTMCSILGVISVPVCWDCIMNTQLMFNVAVKSCETR